jgi:DNA repair protein RadC
MHFQRAESPLKMNDSKAAKAFFSGCFRDCDPAEESLFVVHLDGEARCLHVSRHRGDSCSADFPLRQIIADAALHGSCGLLLAHNHPSGDSRPSLADCRATKRLAAVAEAIECSVLDHLVFGGESCTSFRAMGLI